MVECFGKKIPILPDQEGGAAPSPDEKEEHGHVEHCVKTFASP